MTGDFTSFSTVFQSSGRWKDGNERLFAMEPRLQLKRLPLPGSNSGPLDLWLDQKAGVYKCGVLRNCQMSFKYSRPFFFCGSF